MKVFVAGATGAVGRRLVPLLVAQGHEVVGTTRTPHNVRPLEALGARAVIVDGLDEAGVVKAVTDAAPEVIVHQMTALSGSSDLKRFDDAFAQTNRLRTGGLDHLLKAARAAGTRRVIAQSFTGWVNTREGGPVKDEEDPLDPTPPTWMTETSAAIRYLEETITDATGIEGLALRYGILYGPGTSLGAGGEYVVLIRKRRFPLIGNGAGVWSLVHIDDAVAATVAAVERGAPGLYNIVDDEPAPISEWLPFLARELGAKAPRHLPVWLGRLAVGDVGVSLMTQIRGSSNVKAKRELGWQPRYGSWRQGFHGGLSDGDSTGGQGT